VRLAALGTPETKPIENIISKLNWEEKNNV
jgi:hypothetical protein